MTTRSRRLWVAVAGVATTAPALAHQGHGLFGAHWHASDGWGFVALVMVVAMALAIALYLSRSGKR